MKKLLAVALAGIWTVLLLAGCQSNKSPLGDPPVPMKTVTQNSQGDLATFEFQLPQGWATIPEALLTVIGYPEDANNKTYETELEKLPYITRLSSYYYATGISEEEKQMYKDLFAGNPSAYENKINQPLFGNGEEQGITNEFRYKHYDGAHGRITVVELFSTKDGVTVHEIRCYREDIPYFVKGYFDDSLELSSGNIALWVADSLKVTEHFTLDGYTLIKDDAK